MMFFPPFFFLFLSGDDIVCLFSAVTSIVVVSLTAVVVSVVVVTAASTGFTADGGWVFFPFWTTWVHPSSSLGWSPGSVFFLFFLPDSVIVTVAAVVKIAVVTVFAADDVFGILVV